MTIQRDYSLVDANYLHLDVNARFFMEADTIDAIRSGLQFAQSRDLPVLVLGEGSNVVFTSDYSGLVLKISIPGMKASWSESSAIVEVGAGEQWQQLVSYSLENQLYGLENLSMIPGSVGAAPVQNIGAYGAELKDVMQDLKVLDRESLTERVLTRAECGFDYRDSVFKGKYKNRFIVTSIRLKLQPQSRLLTDYGAIEQELKRMQVPKVTGEAIAEAVTRIRQRRLPDPSKEANVGSFFKNPLVSSKRYQGLKETHPDMPGTINGDRVKLSAAWLIEQCGLKGASCGDAFVSPRHALVLVNRGRATPDDFVELKSIVQSRVLEQYALNLEVEPHLVL
jgi:UDP-N-acetylmuramate dehydrogenase